MQKNKLKRESGKEEETWMYRPLRDDIKLLVISKWELNV